MRSSTRISKVTMKAESTRDFISTRMVSSMIIRKITRNIEGTKSRYYFMRAMVGVQSKVLYRGGAKEQCADIMLPVDILGRPL